MEIWKEITWTNGRYFVSDEGRVMSRNGMKKKCQNPDGVMVQKTNNSGYSCVDLFVNRKYVRCFVHRLVMAAFVGDGDGLDVNHRNGNKQDNRLANLEYCTRKENMAHCASNGLRKDIRKVAAVLNGKVVFKADFSRQLAEMIKAETNTDANIETIARSIRKRMDTNKPYLGYLFIEI